MEPGRWRQIKSVVEAALERAPEERPRFLHEICGGDEELRREAESLLAEEQQTGGFIATPLFAQLSEEDAEGRRIGPYRLVRRLGSGGMGVVYLAERADGQFEQRVALKLLKRGMDFEEVERRFRDERRILAQLVHPSIARLLDGGTTADGRPYFVMEHVEGEPIDRYCARRSLGTAARVELVQRLCGAVALAHRNLVVHRDLKPGNILVTPEGVPKLLDFGIAKLLGPAAQRATTDLLRPMTTEYASPEQLAGQPVSTASDIYSLGALLYELLAGEPPFAGAGEVYPPSRDREPPAPSVVVARRGGRAARKLRRHLIGDLDAIVLKSLRPKPEERYASVEQLAADLKRYLGGLPVMARRGSRIYRLGRRLRRHGGKVAAGLGFALLLAALVVSEVEHRRTEARLDAQRRELEREDRLGERLAAFLVHLLAGVDPARGGRQAITLRELLDRAASSLDQYLPESPLVQAALLGEMGVSYRRDGEHALAVDLLRKSLALRRRALPVGDPQIALSANNLALALREAGSYLEAEALATEALAIYRRHFDPDHPQVVGALSTLAGLRKELGRFDASVLLYRQALAALRRSSEAEEEEGPSGRTLAVALNNLGAALQAQGRTEEAEAVLREALNRLEGVPQPPPLSRANVLRNLGSTLLERGDLIAAEPLLEESLAVRRSVYGGDDHPRVGTILRDLAVLRQRQGNAEAAEALYRRALDILRSRYGTDHPEVALTRLRWAGLLLAKGDRQAAEAEAEQALGVLSARLPAAHPLLAESSSILAAARGGDHRQSPTSWKAAQK